MKKWTSIYILLGVLAALSLFGGCTPDTPTAPHTTQTTQATLPPFPTGTGWVQWQGDSYYLHPDNNGIKHTGWLEMEGKRYFLDAEGRLQTGWLKTQQGTYYLNADGSVAIGWVVDGGKKYYMDLNGLMYFGWLDTAGGRCYLGSDGTPHIGWLELDSGKYYLDDSGYCHKGWLVEKDITYFFDNGKLHTGFLETQSGTAYLDENGALVKGWTEIQGSRYFIGDDGLIRKEWQTLEGKLYYFGTDGAMRTGWQEVEGIRIYFKPEGVLAQGRVEIEGKTCYFTSKGVQVYLVNPWNYLPEDYETEIVKSYGALELSADADAALRQMMKDCKAAGLKPYVCSAYRTQEFQQKLFDNKVKKLIKQGYTREEAVIEAARHVAVPGTSEHQLGLAVDIVDMNYQLLDEKQAQQPAQKWLMEHCWEYGFILRYPPEKTEITGIIYEPWHYRYVGLELAQELHELGLCLEEYLDMLTNDGTSCGGTDKQ